MTNRQPTTSAGREDETRTAKARKILADPALRREVFRLAAYLHPEEMTEAFMDVQERMETARRSGSEYLHRYGTPAP